jgi:putative ABC transport system permease protein
MFKSLFKTAFRSIIRNRNYTVINIAGLATGIAVCMMIFIIIQFHTSFDNFHTNKTKIYRVLTEYHHADSKDIFYGHGVPSALPEGLKTSFPQIEAVVPVIASADDQLVIQNSDQTTKKFKEQSGFFYTDPSFFSIFNFPLLAGSYTSLKDPNNVLVTKETAEKYFGDWHSAIGKTIKQNNDILLKVSGVLASIPDNTDFQLKLVIAYGTGYTGRFKTSTDFDGTSSDFGCYISLPQNVSASSFEKQLRTYSIKVRSPENKDQQTIQHLDDVHYDTQAGTFGGKSISHNMISILWLIAAFILLIACVNFINLSTAQAVNRAKEVGVRKVLGSSQQKIQLQFISETFLIVLAAVVLAVMIAWVSLPFLGNILGLPLKINFANTPELILFLSATSFIVTILAGFYPSVVLSKFNPINALKSKIAVKSTKGISLRRGLVVFQFVIAQTLIIGTLVIVKQMNFFSTQPIGFDKDAVVSIPLPTDSASRQNYNYLQAQLKNINGIEQVSLSSNTPIENNNDSWGTFKFDHAVKETDFYAIFKAADNNYVATYKLPLIAGRNLAASDTMKEFLVNELLVKNLGFSDPQQVLNKEISFNERLKGTIVGVLKDFNTRPFHDDMAPLMITTFKSNYNLASVKLSTKDVVPVMKTIEKIWSKAYPDFVFEYKFLDDKIESFYKQENQLAYLYKIFAAISIFLSCLGLYGLASFMAVQRIKEVGIRKVLGASASHIVYLFSKEFVLLIAIAFLIATPAAWYFMHQWLQHFVFRIELNSWLFIAGGLSSVIIALASVSFQAIKAAVANPVTSLRSE